MSKQFGTFEGLDNRKDLMRMFQRLDKNASEKEAARNRSALLRRILAGGQSPLARCRARVEARSAGEAYGLTIAMAQALGVDLEQAASALESTLRAK